MQRACGPHTLLWSGCCRQKGLSDGQLRGAVQKETNAEMKEGQQEARELSASNYGCNEWWLLLEPTAEPSAKRLRR